MTFHTACVYTLEFIATGYCGAQTLAGPKRGSGTLKEAVFNCGQQFLTMMSKPGGSPFVRMFMWQVGKRRKRRQRWFGAGTNHETAQERAAAAGITTSFQSSRGKHGVKLAAPFLGGF